MTRLSDASALVIVFWPLAVMMAIGAALGVVAKIAVEYMRQRAARS